MAYSSIVLYFFYVVSLEVLTTEWLFSVNPETNFNFILSSQAASCVEIVVLCIKWVETAADVSEILTKKHALIERKNNQNNIFFKLPPSLLITQQQIYVYILIKHFQSILGQCVTWFFCCLNTFKKINSTETSGHWISEMEMQTYRTFCTEFSFVRMSRSSITRKKYLCQKFLFLYI